MSNLTSTQPGAFDAFLALLTTAGQAQNPTVSVFDSAIIQYEPDSYVVLDGFDGHAYDTEPAALGSFAMYEQYDLCGRASVFQGNTDPKAVRDATFALYQNVVMATVVANRGAQGGNPVLGSSAPTELMWIVPSHAHYSASPGSVGGGQAGWQGSIKWAFRVQARITVA